MGILTGYRLPLCGGKHPKKRLTGVLTGIVLIALAAVAGDFSLYMLCSCARRTGKITYVEVFFFCFWVGGFLRAIVCGWACLFLR